MGYLHPNLVRSPLIREIAASTKGEIFGELTALERPADGEFVASGWAILPARHRLADSVLLAYEDAAGEWIIFARADVALSSPEIAQRLQDDAYLNCGWSKRWKVANLPAGVQRVGAWAFDADEARAYPIGVVSK